MTSKDPEVSSNARRHMLKMAVSALISESGFGSIESGALETLVEMVQSFITELGRSSRSFAELAGRTETMLSDVTLGLVEMGLNVNAIPAHAKRANKTVLLPPPLKVDHPSHRILQTGDKMSHPTYIPDHLPEFPDPHTYIKTPSQRQQAIDYQIIREKVSSQKRDVEKALTRFIAKTGDTHCLFKEDVTAFPLIANKPSAIPYLNALLPREAEHGGKPQEPEIQEEVTPARTPKLQEIEPDDQETKEANPDISMTGPEGDSIDNPYLRPVKMPRTKKRR